MFRVALSLQHKGVAKYLNGPNFTLQRQDLRLPMSWPEPRLIFVDSMSDLFHESMPDSYLRDIWFVMERCPQHIFQILTKRPARMRDFCRSRQVTMLNNVWLGTSVELPLYNGRVDILRECPTRNLFVSFEPLLGDVTPVDLTGIRWIIVGGESDYAAPRPMDLEWARRLKQAAINAGSAFFFKQVGGRTKCRCHETWGCRLLDGVIYDGMPNDMSLHLKRANGANGNSKISRLDDF